MSLVDPLLDRIADLKAMLAGQVVLRWGTVTEIDPFRVRLDADTDPLPFKPDRTVSGLTVGDRVYTTVQNRRVTVIGRAGGFPAPPDRTQGEIPTAITTTGAGSSASIAPDGTITVTNCATINLDGIFADADHAVYKVFGTFAQTAVGSLYTRMRAGGTTYSASTYNYVGHYTRNASGPTRFSTFAVPYFGFWWPNPQANSAVSNGELTVYNPNSPGGTTINMQSNVAASDRFLVSEYGESGSTSGAFDGLSIVAAAGAFSGKLKVVRIA